MSRDWTGLVAPFERKIGRRNKKPGGKVKRVGNIYEKITKKNLEKTVDLIRVRALRSLQEIIKVFAAKAVSELPSSSDPKP